MDAALLENLAQVQVEIKYKSAYSYFVMTYAIFFVVGLGLGFTLGLVTWAACSFLGRKVAEIDIQKKNAKAFAEMQAMKTKRDEALATLRSANPDMTERQEKILENELATVFQGRERR